MERNGSTVHQERWFYPTVSKLTKGSLSILVSCNDLTYFYYKDHLGSVRAVVNADNELVSSQDYDSWGYILQDRTFDSDSSKFKFTSKERDVESKYDYFGARYYDARIGRWGAVEPLLNKYISYSPYAYALLNPTKILDKNGKDAIVYINGNTITVDITLYYSKARSLSLAFNDDDKLRILDNFIEDANYYWNLAAEDGIYINGKHYDIVFNVHKEKISRKEFNKRFYQPVNDGKNLVYFEENQKYNPSVVKGRGNILRLIDVPSKEETGYTYPRHWISHELGHLIGLVHPGDYLESNDVMGYKIENHQPPRENNIIDFTKQLNGFDERSYQVIKGSTH